MKAKMLKSISAAALTIALSTAALAGTAQAAGASEIALNSGHSWVYDDPEEWYEEINSESHIHYYRQTRHCNTCSAEENVINRSDIEPHDLRSADWPLRYRCADCGYEE